MPDATIVDGYGVQSIAHEHASGPLPRWPWLALAACLALLLAYALPGPHRTPLHFVLAQFCHGVSAGKMLFLLLFCAAVFARLALHRAPRHPHAAHRPTIFWLAVLIGYAGAMASYLFYIRALNLPIDAPTLHWLDGFNSINSFAHTHTSKAIIALALDWTDLSHLRTRFDTGAPYAPFIPMWISIVIGLAFLTALAEAIRATSACVGRYPAHEQPGVALVYALAACAVVKCILDGGPAAYDAVAGVLTLVLLLRSSSTSELIRCARALLVPIVALVGTWASVLALVSQGLLESQAQRLCYRLCLHAVPLALFAARGREQHPLSRRPAWAVLVVSASGAAWGAWSAARTWLLPLYRPAPALAILHDADTDTPAPTAHALTLDTGATIEAALRSLGENPARGRRVSLPDPSHAGSTALLGQLIPLGAQADRVRDVNEASVVVARAHAADPMDSPRGAWNVDVRFQGPHAPAFVPLTDRPLTILDDHERYVAYHMLDRALRRAGIRQYVLIPYAVRADDHAPALRGADAQVHADP